MAKYARGARRKTQWAGFGNSGGAATMPFPTSVTALSTVVISANAIVAGSAGIIDEEFTVTRTIGWFTMAINSDTALERCGVRIGCAVVRNEVLSAGVASMPDLVHDPDFEWLYFGGAGLINPQNAERDGNLSMIRQEFDVRGQRIVRAGQTLAWVAESINANSVVGVDGRYLVKLT